MRDQGGFVARLVQPGEVAGELVSAFQVEVGLETVEGDVGDVREQFPASHPPRHRVPEQGATNGFVDIESEAAFADRRLGERPRAHLEMFLDGGGPSRRLPGVVRRTDGQTRRFQTIRGVV